MEPGKPPSEAELRALRMSAFRARKEGRVLTPAERLAEREYEARRRKRRVQVMLADEAEAEAWRKAAREAGYRTTGEWVHAVMLASLSGAGEAEVNSWRTRALEAERESSMLARRLTLLESLAPGQVYRSGS